MANPRETASLRDRILIVESDAVISDLIGRQSLQAVGYQVQVATDASSAITRALQWSPDLIIADLNLPGLSGKDLMVALTSQGVQTPIIIIAPRGMESDIIQTFRLGAADYLLLPVREAEVINAVNRVLKQVHERRERERLSQQLQQANQELQARVRELTTIFTLGKAMTSVTDQGDLLEKILQGATRITQADFSWLLLRDDVNRPFVVAAEHNLPAALGVRINQPWDDGISSLVAMSGETLTIHGEPIRRFKISSLGQAALIVPVKVHKKVIGLLVVMRKQAMPFSQSEQHLLNAMADYASISLVNARLFRTVDERARAFRAMADNSQMGQKVANDLLRSLKKEIVAQNGAAQTALDQLTKDPTSRWRSDQRQQLAALQEQLAYLRQVAEAITPLQLAKNPTDRPQANLTEQANQALRRAQAHAQRAGVTLVSEVPSEALPVPVEAGLLAQVLEAMLADAVRAGSSGESVSLRLERGPESQAQLVVAGSRVLDARAAEKLFDDADPPAGAGRFSGLTVRLGLAREIITRAGGKLWLETPQGRGSELHLTLPLAR